jgi:hypothetical protein
MAKKSIYIRGIDENAWIEYQVQAKREGISAAEKIRRHIVETIKKKQPKK